MNATIRSEQIESTAPDSNLAAVSEVEEGIREFVRNDIAYLRRPSVPSPETAPADPQANNNLLLLYMQTNQRDRAKMQVQKMQQMGLEVPADILRQLKQ